MAGYRLRFDSHAPPITADDAAIRAAVADAAVPPLLAAVAHATGDHSVLRDDLRPSAEITLDPNGGYSPAQVETARALAVGALARHRDSGSPTPAPLDAAGERGLVNFVTGAPADDALFELYREELALDGVDLRAPGWTKAELAPDRDFRIAIIGAGMSGIAVAHRLLQAGLSVTIFEKNADVGGTWLDNTYPGCRVDVQSHFYSYSFAQTGDWPSYNSTQPVLLDYFRQCADYFGVRPHIRFETEVTRARWDDTDQHWVVHTRGSKGDATQVAHALISAVGQLNRPHLPDIAGHDCFRGPSFHSARWRHDVDLTGKRIAVIGTGASALQFIPLIVEKTASLTIYQRTPAWLLPVPTYELELPQGLRWVLDHLPSFSRWDRLYQFARMQEGLLPLTLVDAGWPDKSRSVSAANDQLRAMLTMYYDAVFPDAELRNKLLPHYPPTAKRVVLDGGNLAAALRRDDVELVTTSIEHIAENGIVTTGGEHREHDVIIYGTGFHASQFLTPMQITGARGVDLHATWRGDARAYKGIVLPGFPNFFMMYGPNTNIVINGSIIYFSECEATYVLDCIRALLATGARSLDCRSDVHARYNERIDAGNRVRTWGASDVNSWYKNEFGRVAQNWPFNLFEYWNQTRAVDLDDFVVS